MKSRSLILFLLLYFHGNAQNTRRDIDSIENIVKTTQHNNRRISEMAILVQKYFIAGEDKKSKVLYASALKEALATRSDSALGMLYHVKGNVFYYESKFDSALVYFEKAVTLRKRIKDNIGFLKSNGNLGSIYFMNGDYETALRYYEETMKTEAALGFEEGKYFSVPNLAAIYQRLKMYDKALSLLRKSEKIYEGKPAQLASVYDGLSDAFDGIKQTDSALKYSFAALSIAQELKEIRAENHAHISIGLLYNKLKKPHIAREHFLKSLELSKLLKDKRYEIAALGNLAAFEVDSNRTDSALKYIERIVQLKKELNITTNQEDLAKLFAQYYFNKKDYKSAYEQLYLYDKYTDSLYNIETNSRIAEIQEKYESDKKDRENQILQHENKTYKTTRNYLLVILLIALTAVIGAVFAYRKIKRSKELVMKQKHLIEEKQKEILDSINYAKRIQYALLASDNLLSKHLPSHFVLFRPKDVVSGDFYWATPSADGFIFVTADCTGHGVPGAFMSLLNISKLSQAINENNIIRPDLILNEVRSEIIAALNPEGSKDVSKDGMDAVVCKLDLPKMRLQFSAANNSFYIIRNGQIITCKADKMPVGKGHDDSLMFSFNEIELHKGDMIYTFTDGFADQFGGPLGKKFKYKQLEELLLKIHLHSVESQKQTLDETFTAWKGSLEQVDDMCIIGVRI
ncbi:MAG: tetratricopeptide repeat protein [Bacteroidia bacterium]|nr:tetratricopeptide repeat protein [Bacteroidia bacterium]